MAAIIKFSGNLGDKDIFYKAEGDGKKAFAAFEIAQTSPLWENGEIKKDENGKAVYSNPAWYKVIAYGIVADRIIADIKPRQLVEVKGRLGEPEAFMKSNGAPGARNIIVASSVKPILFETKKDGTVVRAAQQDLQSPTTEQEYFDSNQPINHPFGDPHGALAALPQTTVANIATPPTFSNTTNTGVTR
jgi:hypothetical protein